tara:strand:- start:417 stop:1304 length:888 start_codon:yes stop_codon:yes gene_type:complete
MKKVITFLTEIYQTWFKEDLFTQAAAAAYYAVFSLPGLILIATAIASLFFDRTLVQSEVNDLMHSMIGSELTFNVQNSLNSMEIMGRQWIAFLIGLCIILYGASRFFMQLQKSLNLVWGVIPKKTAKIQAVIRKRFISLVLVLSAGFVLLIMLTVTSFLTLLSDYIALQIPLLNIDLMLILNWSISYFIVVGLFTLLYKIVPDVKVEWLSAMYGALFSAALFMVGQACVNYYFSVANPQSVFGAAGSIILLMLWVSYAFIILLLGANFCKTHMERTSGRKAEPEREIAKKGKQQP